MKKMLAIILVVALSACMLSACGVDKEQEKKDVLETAESFIKLYYNGSPEVYDYINEQSPVYEDVKETIENLSQIIELVEGAKEEFEKAGVSNVEKYVEEIETVFYDFQNDIFEILEYREEEIILKKDEATAVFYIKSPNASNIKVMAESLDIEEILLEVLSVKDLEQMSKVTSVDDMMPYMIKAYKGLFDYFVEQCEENTEEGELTLKFAKIKDKWLVQDMEQRTF